MTMHLIVTYKIRTNGTKLKGQPISKSKTHCQKSKRCVKNQLGLYQSTFKWEI